MNMKSMERMRMMTKNNWKELEDELRSKLVPKSVSEDGKLITYQVIQYEGSIGNTEYWTDDVS